MPLTPHPQPDQRSLRRGMVAGVGAYAMWGVLPLYFPLMAGAGVWEIGAHRVLWSMLFCGLLLALTGTLGQVRALLRDRGVLGRLALASSFLAANWVTFLYAVLTDRVVDASLGYFINPIITVLLAVLVLRERLRPMQWVAIGIAAVGVVVITIGYGTMPWVAVVLAGSFGIYGLAKNRIGRTVPALPGLLVETTALMPVSLAYVVVLGIQGTGTFLTATDATALGHPWHSLALAGSGIATAVPLVCFAVATRALPLSTVGLLQFIAPTMQFIIGVAVLGEQMPAARWAGFVLVWVALVLLGVEGQRARRRPAGPVPPAPQ